MTAQPNFSPRFVRRTRLAEGEYRKNFHQVDREAVEAVTSKEADRVTPLMSKVYLRLVNVPAHYWERDGVLRFEAEVRGEGQVKAWAVLCELLGVASATASKALRWMHEQGVIGYFAGKNGVGIRIFLNRAASSIGTRSGKKILEFSPASSRELRASPNEAAFNDSFADLDEVSDTDFNSRAPKDGAPDEKTVGKTSPEPQTELDSDDAAPNAPEGREVEASETRQAPVLSVGDIVRQLKLELEPTLQQAARQAARQEHERTREWLESRGLPKAARVAQREAYNVLRNHGVINAAAERARNELEVGRNTHAAEAKPLTEGEIKELAEMCLAMLETHGQSIDTTLAEISSEAGGCLLAEDAPLVRALAQSMLRENDSQGGD
ncbi:MAG TPA: hypothetical protein VJ715_13940 [Pyrinomonadaceae bacterium]|nr:hypothetical protein [Pyrinomonadaceae bacterium]